jgi:hypothetical protein
MDSSVGEDNITSLPCLSLALENRTIGHTDMERRPSPFEKGGLRGIFIKYNM